MKRNLMKSAFIVACHFDPLSKKANFKAKTLKLAFLLRGVIFPFWSFSWSVLPNTIIKNQHFIFCHTFIA
jgi:hypothetical protein